jgi:hypothetical protein
MALLARAKELHRHSWFDDEDDLDDDHFMPSEWAKKASSTKVKRVAKP